jgi:hypothetical protein
LNKKSFIIILFIFININIYSENDIKAVFVSNFDVISSDGKALLSWKNPSNFNDNITIYKSGEIIDTESKISKASKIITLKNNEEKYIDTLSPGNNFYAVLITGRVTNMDYLVLIPYRNFNSTPVLLAEDDITDDVYKITKCSASSNKTSIIFDWNYATDSQRLARVVIYRNVSPISSDAVLNTSIKISTSSIDSKIFVDVPISGINYYYAVFIENEKNKQFVPGVSYTTNPVYIEKKAESIENFSSDSFIPLPLLTLQNDPTTGKKFNDPQILKNPQKINYNAKLNDIIKNYKKDFSVQYDRVIQENKDKVKHLDFKFLNDEAIYNAGDYTSEYSKIISLLKSKDYDKSLDIIEQLVIDTIPNDLESRLEYYAGMIYYINEDYYRSYLNLILSYDNYRNEVIPYLDSIYYIIFSTLER